MDVFAKLEQIVVEGFKSSRYMFEEFWPVDSALIKHIGAIGVCPMISRLPESEHTLRRGHGGSQERLEYLGVRRPWWVSMTCEAEDLTMGASSWDPRTVRLLILAYLIQPLLR